MATPILELEEAASVQAPNPYFSRVVNTDTVLEVGDVFTNTVNYTGAALTYLIRFIVLLPMVALLIVAELLYRLDRLIASQSRNIAAFFGGGR